MLLDTSSSYTDFFSSTTNGYNFPAADRIVEVGNGVWHVCLLLGSFGLVITLMICMIKIMGGGAAKRSEAKREIPSIMLTGVLLSALPAFIALVIEVAETFFVP